MKKYFTCGIILVSAIVVNAQSIKEFYRLCNPVPLSSQFTGRESLFEYEYSKYAFGRTYRFSCDQVKSLYNLPILKTLIHVSEDTVVGINIFLPFDSTLGKRMEREFGPTEVAWMMFPPDQLDTAGIIWDKRWVFDEYIVWFRCTRYIYMLGEMKEDREDLIIVTLLPNRRRVMRE